MPKLSNSQSSSNTGISALRSYTVVGGLAIGSSAINGKYSLYTTFASSFPADHGFTNFQNNVGSLTIKVSNVTQGYVEKASVPLNVLLASGTTVFFRIGTSAADAEFEDFGMTNPSSGDVLKISAVPNVLGYTSPTPYTQNITLS